MDPFMLFANTLVRLQGICLSLPEAEQGETWGEPNFKVNDKVFASCLLIDSLVTLSYKMDKGDAAAFVSTHDHVERAKYIGHHGWVQVTVTQDLDWTRTRKHLVDSYRLLAPKRLAAQVGFD